MASRRLAQTAPSATGRRCAIYTRKSSEEGLELAFNSLDAQREACEAYARSQRHEGWTLLPARYDDGGLSGGTLERPGLRRLLGDIRAGKVDLVLVYKVDRLTRSLADFAKIVEVMDAHGTSFVSVTQQFNTATSMGRLTLNMLLSFAQFEREVAGERIRDKIAASKRKGLWMGGSVPLGYAARDRKLVVDGAEAERVRHIFRSYVALGSVRLLGERLAAEGVRSKSGQRLGRGPLFHLLQNRTYRGEVAHRGNVYPGEHAAIVDAALWEAAQRRLAENRHERRSATHAASPSLLAGLLTDPAGEPMTPTHAVKGRRRYRYYASRRLILEPRAAHPDALRLPAGDIERLVAERLRQMLTDSPALLDALRGAGLLPASAAAQHRLLQRARQLAEGWPTRTYAERRALLSSVLSRIDVGRDEVVLHLLPDKLLATLTDAAAAEAPGQQDTSVASAPLALTVPATLRRAGQEMRLVVGSTAAPSQADAALVALIAKAHAVRDRLLRSEAESIAAFAAGEGVSKSYVIRLLRLAWLAPDIVAAILDGQQPAELTTTRLMRDTRLPLDWHSQRQALGFG